MVPGTPGRDSKVHAMRPGNSRTDLILCIYHSYHASDDELSEAQCHFPANAGSHLPQLVSIVSFDPLARTAVQAATENFRFSFVRD